MKNQKRKSRTAAPDQNQGQWPFPAVDLTSLLKLANRSPREEPNAIRTMTVNKLKQLEAAPL
jgi:hypothetical protein